MTPDADPSKRSSDTRPSTTRRGLLAAIGGAGLASGLSRSVRANETSTTIHVAIYPGPLPLPVWFQYGFYGIGSGWAPIYRDAAAAVERVVERLASYAERHTSVDTVDARVERRSIDHPLFSRVARGPLGESSITDESLFDAFRSALHDTGSVSGSCCHLLLWWGPTNYDLGYGGTNSPNYHVCELEDEGSQTIANVGATELWDSRAVTRNIAIHETLHPLLSHDVVEDVVGNPCDHHLGDAVRIDEETLRISPLATAYAEPERLGSGTFWPGTGCVDADGFSRHDGNEGIERWEYTTDPSPATREAVALYVDRHLAQA